MRILKWLTMLVLSASPTIASSVIDLSRPASESISEVAGVYWSFDEMIEGGDEVFADSDSFGPIFSSPGNGETPGLVCKIGHAQNRTMALYQNSGLIYTVTRGNYGQLGGTISVIDPANGECEVFRNFVPTQNPVSLFQHGELLVGTTEVYGDQGSCPAEAENAVIFVWSMVERNTVHSLVPWPAESLRALALSSAGTLIGFGQGKYFLFEVETGCCSL